MAWNLDGRVALITGAGSGIGAELARQLAARGMRLALIDVNGEALEAVAAGLPGAETAVADVRDAEALTAAIDDLAARCGGLDVAVAQRGHRDGRAAAARRARDGRGDARHQPARCLAHRRGRRSRTCSRGAAICCWSRPRPPCVPTAGLGAYSASKAGVEALGRSLRVELRTHGVGVGVAYYLFLNTPMVAAGDDSPIFARTEVAAPGAAGEDVAAGARGRAHRARRSSAARARSPTRRSCAG